MWKDKRREQGSKYHAVRIGGHASMKEHRRAVHLKIMERAGMISELREQVEFKLIPPQRSADGRFSERGCSYIADFVYKDSEGRLVVEDTKGVRTDVYKIKRKLMMWVHGIVITET